MSHRSNSYSYQPFNKLTATQTASYGYDANGSTINKIEGSKRWTYFWDYENRLTRATDRKHVIRYVYDALGRRVARRGGVKGTVKFTYEGEEVLMDEASDGTITKYLNGPRHRQQAADAGGVKRELPPRRSPRLDQLLLSTQGKK
ncbi:MAG: hypothetical protein ACK4S4_08935 [Pyrinomonadaceae bacterium]